MVSGKTVGKILVSGQYLCEDHNDNQVYLITEDVFPRCSKVSNHVATRQLNGYKAKPGQAETESLYKNSATEEPGKKKEKRTGFLQPVILLNYTEKKDFMLH